MPTPTTHIVSAQPTDVPFDISCNRLRSTVRWMEAHRGQEILTVAEKLALWTAVKRLDKVVSRILDAADKRREAA